MFKRRLIHVLFWLGLAGELVIGVWLLGQKLGMAYGLLAIPFGIGLVTSALGSLPKPRLRIAVAVLCMHLGAIALVGALQVYGEVEHTLYGRSLRKAARLAHEQVAQRTALRRLLSDGQIEQAKHYVREHDQLDVKSTVAMRDLFCSARRQPIDAELLKLLREQANPIPGDLLSAAAQCSRAATQVVLDSGVSVGAVDSNGRKALMTGTDLDALLLLIQRGAAVNARTADGATALMFHRTPEVTGILLQLGANPKAVDKVGRSPLHYGGPPEHLAKCFELLLAAGADPNLRDTRPDTHYTPLIAMAVGEFIDKEIYREWVQNAADVLVAHSADPLTVDASGSTALEYQLSSDNTISASLAWPTLKVTGIGGAQLLVAAVRAYKAEAVAALLKAGANPTLPDFKGVVPIEAYWKSKLTDLEPAGADKLLVDVAAQFSAKDAGTREGAEQAVQP